MLRLFIRKTHHFDFTQNDGFVSKSYFLMPKNVRPQMTLK